MHLALLDGDAGLHDQASAGYRRAEGLLRPLVENHPEELAYVLALAAVYSDWGNQERSARSDFPRALELHDKAVQLLEAARRREPEHQAARGHLMNTYASRAQTLGKLGRHVPAAQDWKRAAEFATGSERQERKTLPGEFSGGAQHHGFRAPGTERIAAGI